LIGVCATPGNQSITEAPIALRNAAEAPPILHADVVAQIVSNTMHARPVIPETLAGLANIGPRE
jgi:hypothetical protein